MNTKWVPVNRQVSSVRRECSVEALSERLFERILTFAEIAEISEKCGLWDIEKERKAFSPPLTFGVPAIQFVGSFSRIVE